jgi:ATP-dependent exoDNAse (exonuclease V) alpha subunit
VLTTLLKYDVIFIDEISMVHCDLFDIIMQMCFTLEPLLKQFHKSMPQFILCGDFYQLPPIDKTENNHEKCMCFSSKY